MSEIPNDPDLPLRTVRMALLGTADRNDPSIIAECLLLHAHLRIAITSESPLAALRNGNVSRAWALADLSEPNLCLLWHLVVTWELCEHDRHEAARETLDRVISKPLPRLPKASWEERCADILLPFVSEVSDEILLTLSKQILHYQGRDNLSRALEDKGLLNLALEVARQNKGPLLRIAHLQAKTGAFSQALQTAQQDIGALSAVARVQAERQQFEDALVTAQKIGEGFYREITFQEIVEEQAKAREFARASRTAMEIKSVLAISKALAVIAREQFIVGQNEQARTLFDKARRASEETDSISLRADALIEVADEQVKAGDYLGAVQTAARALEVA